MSRPLMNIEDDDVLFSFGGLRYESATNMIGGNILHFSNFILISILY